MTGKEKVEKQYIELGNEIIRLRNNLGNDSLRRLFSIIPLPEYLVLTMLMRNLELYQEDKKVYLKEIAAELNMKMPVVSGLVQRLQGSGLVIWKHDGAGNEGTYITLSEHGRTLLTEQREILADYFEKVVSSLGIPRTREIMQAMQDLQSVMDQVIQEG